MPRPKNPDSNHDKLAEAHRRLAQAVAELTPGDDWQTFLTLAAKLHGYSARNVLLIASQAPWATHLAGYRKWQQLGRQVRAGEKGIAILAPCRYRAAPDRHSAADDDTGEAGAGRVVVTGFRVVHVFDISSTDGPEIVAPPAPELLRGEAPAGLWDHLAALAAAEGFTVERGHCNGANGVTCFDRRVVRIRDDIDDSQAAKSLAHELGHALLHDGSEYAAGCRGRIEVEAESVAYLVCAAAGLNSATYSVAYVTGWAGGDADIVQATAERVVACAQRITAHLTVQGEMVAGIGDAREPAEQQERPVTPPSHTSHG